MACMHMQTVQSCSKHNSTRSYNFNRSSVRPMKAPILKAAAHDSSIPGTDVSRILQQHRLLMEHGFSYDQASLILQISEQRLLPRPAGTAAASTVAATAAGVSPITADSPLQDSTADDSQQPQPSKSIEDRLSFIEMELLKQSISLDTVSTIAGLADDSSSSSTSTLPRHESASSEVAAAAAAVDLGMAQLDPGVLAIAESLLIRQGRVLPAPGVQNRHTADSTLYRQWGTAGDPAGASSNYQAGSKTPSSIWGRTHAMRQLRAKPWRYVDQESGHNSSPGFKRAARQQMLPYGYLPDADMLSSHDLELAGEGDLVPYEPNGWSVAFTILMVYAGIMLTFFACIAGTAEGSGTIDPDLLMMLTW